MRFANSGTEMPQHQPIAHDGFHLAKPAFSEHSNVDYLINKFKRTRTFPSLPKLIHDPPSSSRPRYDKTPRSRESNGDFVANIDCLLHDGSLLQELARSLASDSCSIFSCLSTWYEKKVGLKLLWFHVGFPPQKNRSCNINVCVLHHPHKTWLYTTRNSAFPHPTGQNWTTSQTPHHPLARHLFGSQGILEVWWYTTLFHTEEAIQ